MDGTIIGQGTFTVPAAGVIAQNIAIPSGTDWLYVYNYTQAGINGAANTGINFYWQRGMAAGTGMVWYKTVAGVALLSQDTYVSGGFTLLDTSLNAPGVSNALTGITAANPPVVTTAATLPAVGSVVRIINPNNQAQIGGLDFTVTAAGGGTFTIGNINLSNSTATTAGFWRQIPFDPIFYPRRRYVTFVRAAAQAVIYLSVTHQYAVGQIVRLSFPGGSAVWGTYAALDGIQATITAVNVARAGTEPNNAGTANNIQVNVDTSAFGAWNVFGAGANQGYPAAGLVPFTPAAIIPEGEDSAFSLSTPLAQVPLDYNGLQVAGTNNGLLSDATVNTAFIGMTLGVGGNGTALGAQILGPAGAAAADVMYWRAGKSSFGGL